jgi:hypothetical protein
MDRVEYARENGENLLVLERSRYDVTDH